jgi:hypothetical protein
VVPPDALRIARLHRARQQQLAAAAVRETRRRWGLLGGGDVGEAWQQIAGAVLRLVAAFQLEAARGADAYVGAVLTASGGTPRPAGQVATAALAGVASDGRDLGALLGYPAFEVSAFLAQGMDAGQALAIGGRHLDRIVQTQVQDSARVATGLAQVNDRAVRGYVRVVSLPACARCVELAGRWYRYNSGFERHPQCDCVMMPAAEVLQPQSPRALYEAMNVEQRKAAGWSGADVQAIADGADLYQVVNARRQLRTVTVAGQRLQATGVNARRRIRLTPESIYAEADRLGWSRDELLRALRAHGYIL